MRVLRNLAVVVSGFAGAGALLGAIALTLLRAGWLAGFAAAASFLCAGVWLWGTRNHRKTFALSFLVASAICLARIHATRASGTGLVTSWRVSRGASPGGSFIPEKDVMAVAARVLPWVWRWPPSAVRDNGFRDAVDRQYATLDQDPETHGLESVLLAQTLGMPGAAGHYFLVLPRASPPPHGYPVLLFLHGFGGNSQLYAGWARNLAERFGVVTILPTATFDGAWWRPGDQVFAQAALEDAAVRHPLDLGRVVVGGLSNGGVGAAKLARGSRFMGLLSVAAFPREADVARGLGKKPAVFLAARQDDRFPIDGLREAAAMLRAGGSAVEVIETEGDHLAVVQDPSQLEKALRKLCQLGANVCDRD